jgi:protein phosphatase
MSMDSQINTAVAIDPGRVRSEQQDAKYVDGRQGLLIVADGMGGHRGGDVASKMVTRRLPDRLEPVLADPQAGPDAICEGLVESIQAVSRELYELGRSQPEVRGLGATVVMAWVNGPTVFVAHMGDSRAYLFRAGRLRQVTDDHSVVGLLVRNRMILPEEAKSHPARHQLSRYVGMSGEAGPEAHGHSLEVGDRLLLCSDGLTGMVEDERIAGILGGSPDPDAAARLLVSAANHAGGVDNITVALADVQCLQRPAPPADDDPPEAIMDPLPPQLIDTTRTQDFGGERIN